jgi:RNA recognition motif-containing protein
LKNKGFKEEKMTQVGLYAIGKSTTLESNKSLISNLASTTTAHELRQLFAPYGVVDGGYILHERETRQAPGCGFVTMPQAPEAQAAIAGLQGTRLAGRTLTIHEARPRW